MTADSPASGLPQEAVDAATWSQLSEADLRSYRVWRNAQLRDALAAERAKVAALQQAVDKVRELHNPVHYCEDKRGGRDWYGPGDPCPTVALLPDVQADDRGTCAHIEHHEWKGVRVGIVAFDRQQGIGNWEPCPAAVVQPNVTPATTCADCGTTRTICDAGLNTYDTRCCEQCGHGEGK